MGGLFHHEEEKLAFTITQQQQQQKTEKLPLLFMLGELNDEINHGFFDPVEQTVNVVEFPELGSQTECISSGYGWLLLLSRETSSIFFFNPVTRQRINLPYRSSVINAATFSAPPTSPNCSVFTIERDSFNGKIHIDALRAGQERVWTRYAYYIGWRNEFGIIVQAVVSNNILYFVDSRGRIGSFNITNANWEVVSDKKFKRCCISYLVECNGEVFGVKTQNYGVIDRVYKLKSEERGFSWEAVKGIGGVTMFLGPYGSCAFSGLNGELKNKIFVARDNPESKCVIYNVDGGECKKAMRFHIIPFSWWYAPVWIEREGNAPLPQIPATYLRIK